VFKVFTRKDMHRGPIVALIGIDGAGKSSVIDRLRTDPRFSTVQFVRKKKRYCVDSIATAFPDAGRDEQDYLHGPFAAAVRWAHAFDFLRFYEEEVRPHIDSAACIVSDRWSVCSAAFAAEGPQLDSDVEEVLGCVPPADLLIYLEVSPDLAMKRITSTRRPFGDESLCLLEAFRVGYERVLQRAKSIVVRIDTSDFPRTVREVERLVMSAVPRSFHG